MSAPPAPTPRRGEDVTAAVAVLAWIGLVLVLDGVRGLDRVEGWRQAVLGLGTWLVLAALTP